MAKSVALWRFIPPGCRACRAWVWLRSSSAIIHVYVPWFVGWDDETPSREGPTKRGKGNSSTQECLLIGDVSFREGTCRKVPVDPGDSFVYR